MQQVEKMKKMEDKKIPDNIDYDAISGIATEAKQNVKASKTIIHCTSISYIRRKSSGHFNSSCLY